MRTQNRVSTAPKLIKTFPEYLSGMVPAKGMDFVVYRGQRCQSWPLWPKIAHKEYRATGRWTIVKEGDMLKMFKEHASGLLGPSVRLYNDWELLALAQHFGMATKYLDWTKNPLVALWFCVERDSANGENGVVWKLERKKRPENPGCGGLFDGKSGTIKFYEPSHVTMRIRVQAGVFTVHYSDPDKKEAYVPLERAAKRGNFDALTKYIIPHDKFYGFRKELDRLGVNALSLFPDVEHLCDHINWLNTLPGGKRDDIRSFDPKVPLTI
jgi:hypothetical protein